jgi:hypothetical protein
MRKCLILLMFCCATPSSAQLLLYDGFSPSAETEPPAALN